jgi:hypothetical protein
MRYLPPGVERRRVLLAFASLWLCACGESRPVEGVGGPVDPGAGGETCIADDWCAGAARVVVSPSQQHVDGIEEARLYVGTKLQQFNLGGFGINPLQNLPSPFAELGAGLTQPAQQTAHESLRYGEVEHTHLRLLLLEHAGQRVVFVTLDAIGAPFARSAKLISQISKVDRYAVVTDTGWIAALARAEGGLLPGIDVQVWPRAERDEAIAWASEPLAA